MGDVAIGGDASCLATVGTEGVGLVVLLGTAGRSMVEGARDEEPRRERCRKVTFDLR